jgi:hypothetical protein
MSSYKGGRGGDGGAGSGLGHFQHRPSTTTSHHFLRAQSLLFEKRAGNERQSAYGNTNKNRDAALQRLHQTGMCGHEGVARLFKWI